jgi:acylphosphatase
VCEKFRISGRVQGVFFRDSTRDVAIALKLDGHAINLADGSVEVIACGSHEAVDRLSDWLQEGPRLASVTGVIRTATTCEHPVRFVIG